MHEINPKGWPWDPTHLVLDEIVTYDTHKQNANFTSPNGLFVVQNGVVTCYPGIVWDGTTCVPDGGVDPQKPNFPMTWKASLVHDQFCKYTRESEQFRKFYTRADGDRYFYDILTQLHFKWAILYYIGVRFWSIVNAFFRFKHHDSTEYNEHQYPKMGPCPSCRSRTICLVSVHNEKNVQWKFICSKCGKMSTPANNVGEAVSVWNKGE